MEPTSEDRCRDLEADVEWVETIDFTRRKHSRVARDLKALTLAALRRAHGWLDGAGVPHDPYPEHTAASGCRVSGRLGWLLRRAEAAEAEVARLKAMIETALATAKGGVG